VQSDYKNKDKWYLVYTYLRVLLSQASACVKYLLFTLIPNFAGLLVVKQALCWHWSW